MLFNAPALPIEHPDSASERGVIAVARAVADQLNTRGFRAWIQPAGPPLHRLLRRLDRQRPDLIFNLLEGFAGDSDGESHGTALLELMGFPYTGCPPLAQALGRRKAATKRILIGHGLPTAPFAVASDDLEAESAARSVPLPAIVKPEAEDASLGLDSSSVAFSLENVLAKARKVRERHGGLALIEAFLPGREFNVGVLAIPDPTPLPIAEVIHAPGPGRPPILTYAGKWTEGSDDDLASPVRCPADIDPDLAARLGELAVSAFRATGCRDYARVDIRLDADGSPMVLEVNPNPDLDPSAGFARALKVAGLHYGEILADLARQALARGGQSAFNKVVSPTTRTGTTAFADVPTTDVRPTQPTGRSLPDFSIRGLLLEDRGPIAQILRDSGVFRPDEVGVGLELLDESLTPKPDTDYRWVIAEGASGVLGFACYGPVPLTDATYDLYWIAVALPMRGTGLASRLESAAATDATARGARWLIAETSTTTPFEPARRFYLRNGYRPLGEVPDFYRPGDGRLTFGKRLDRIPAD